MCKQTIIFHPSCSHRGYGLIIPCISRALHPAGFKRFTIKSDTKCPLPSCDGPKAKGCYTPAGEGNESIIVNGSPITGFVLYSSDVEVVKRWEKGDYPLADEGYKAPISLSAIPVHMLTPIADALQVHCYTGEGRGFQRLRQARYWSCGPRWRVGDAEGDVWGEGEEMPKGLPSAWNEVDGFEMGKTGPVVPRELEKIVGEMLKSIGGDEEFNVRGVVVCREERGEEGSC